jgi:hypothetical protein
MPTTCRTCKGEYDRGECICPVCGQELGKSANLCHQCGVEIRGRRLCPRCKSDVSVWEEESLSLKRFIARGGFTGLLPTLVAMISWIAVWESQENSIHHPVGTIVGIVLSLLVFNALYSGRYSLRERSWASEIYHVPGPSLFWIGTGSFLMGIVLMISAFTLYKLWATPTHFLQRLLFSLVYGLAYVGLTTGLTFLALQGYLTKLNARVPQPLFVHTDRLIEVVIHAAAKSLEYNRRECGENKDNSQGDRKGLESFEVIEASRDPADGGITILARGKKFTQQQAGDSDTGAQWTERTLAINADRWGRIRSFRIGPPVEDNEYYTHRALR